MKCPKCGKSVEVSITKNPPDKTDYVEVEIVCEDEHIHFVRVKEEDFIEC